MKTSIYKEFFKRGVLTACMPLHLGRIGFIHKDVADEDYKKHYDEFGSLLEPRDLPTRMIVYWTESTKIPVGAFGVASWAYGLETAHLSAHNDDWIVCDANFFDVNEPRQKTQWYQMPNNQHGQLAKGMVNIAGEVYAYGMVRSVFKHVGLKKWINITDKKSHPNLYADLNDAAASGNRLIGGNSGFSAMDGFSAEDIYAGGNHGDFWRYLKQDGKLAWRKIDLPINTDISAIKCAPNGLVYVCSRGGPVLVGRDNTWTTIDKYKQTVHCDWFQGRVYFSDKNGLIYTHNEGETELQEATFKTKFPEYMDRLIQGLAACEECLVVYTVDQAYAYDGEIWHEIIELPSLSKLKMVDQ